MKQILIVNANYYKEITKRLVKSATNVFSRKKYNLSIITVPGVFEIPIAIEEILINMMLLLQLVVLLKVKHLILILL